MINQGVLIRFVGNPHVYQAPESNCFIAVQSSVQCIIFTSEFFGDYSYKIIALQ